MDYFDEYDDTRPRYLLTRGGGSSVPDTSLDDTSAVSRPHLAACLSASFLLSLAAFYAFRFSYDALFSVLVWFALSLLLAPFAPSSATGGSVCVGRGPALPDPVPETSPADAADLGNSGSRRSRSRKQVDRSVNESVAARSSTNQKRSEQKGLLEEKSRGEEEKKEKEEEKDWTEEDFDLLKKQMSKYPVAGDPNRWDKIASAFRGRHGVDSVIRTTKSVQEMKARGEDPFEQFLKRRKPVDPRAEAAISGDVVEPKAELKEIWSSGDDLALLNALKAFPKDVSMRWEKIAAAVPGKSKAGCMRRVSELKKDFRSMKASD